jgi:hypothetical protein
VLPKVDRHGTETGKTGHEPGSRETGGGIVYPSTVKGVHSMTKCTPLSALST